MQRILLVLTGIIGITLMANQILGAGEHRYNEWYSGEYLNRGGLPLGGIGAGMICMDSTGSISQVSVRNHMEFFNEPLMFAAVSIKGNPKTAKVIEAPVPMWKAFGAGGTGNGRGGTSWGLPRFAEARFKARIPFGILELKDNDNPLDVTVTGWSPFIPGDADNSSLPAGAFEYTFTNPTGKDVEAVFSYHSDNFMEHGREGEVLPLANGFILWQQPGKNNPEREGGFAIFLDGAEKVTVDHCWFKGGWFDPLTIAWRTVQEAGMIDNPPTPGHAAGASLYAPFTVPAGKSKTLRLMMCWYVPQTTLTIGVREVGGPAFGDAPSQGTAPDQQTVSGFLGSGLVNTFDPDGDGQIGTLTSPGFTITANRIHFLIGGGNHPYKACMNLLIDGEIKRTATGKNDEKLDWETWNVGEFKGKTANLQIVDNVTGNWGHINVDHIIMTDAENPTKIGASPAVVLADFEGNDYGIWTKTGPKQCCAEGGCEKYYKPWYAGKFKGIREIADYWRRNYDHLRQQSDLFQKTFYDTTLPPEVVEAAAANITILKSPTCLRQTDGRFWAFEGCGDNVGCCHGSCTHVWGYAQAMPHLFPDLERTLRETEFFVCQDDRGHQTFRCPLPISEPDHNFHAAADGQLGGIMKVYREWRISGDNQWLKKMWPKVKQSLEYCIGEWDPRGKGVLEEPHHNTYDIEYWGPEGHCTSVYLGALEAAAQMGEFLGEDVNRYRELIIKGREFLETKLYDGEYFFQIVQTEGLNHTFRDIDYSANGPGYKDIVKTLNTEGPKYQYGTGCLSDGVFGFWLARACGLKENADAAKIRSHLASIHRYNLKDNLMDHYNPQRPTFAMGEDGGLLLCTWPKGSELLLPFVYSNEVWTGIEYQVAAHCMMHGLVNEGLEIVRECRDRYDGRIRNPFNEYE
ncbi:MAG: hypothetical protein JW709_08555, partial [Sedimentisphaerales bacterium]|nr:hypothetical protein [Sedimentisphaerales bacterium]